MNQNLHPHSLLQQPPFPATLSKEALIQKLGGAMGEEKARLVVEQATLSLGYRSDSYTKEETLAILDKIAEEGGLVAVVARFAKAQYILDFPGK